MTTPLEDKATAAVLVATTAGEIPWQRQNNLNVWTARWRDVPLKVDKTANELTVGRKVVGPGYDPTPVITVIEQAVVPKVRPWEEWTGRTRMTPEARADLDRFVLTAPAACRDAFAFRVEGGRIESFTDRMLLIRADRD